MKKLLFFLLLTSSILATAQTVTNINPNTAYQGQSLHTTITSSALFMTGSSPQGNIQDIILKRANDSVFAILDSTKVVNTNSATAFWSMPGTLTTGIYNLAVRIYNTVSQTFADYFLNSSFTITAPSATITGTVYNDRNHNGVKDAGEAGLQGYVVKVKQQGNTATSDALGNYTIGTITGLDTLIITQPADDVYATSGVSQYILTVPAGATSGKNFGLKLDRYLISMTPDSAVVGQNVSVAIVGYKLTKNATLNNVLIDNGHGSMVYASSFTATDTNHITATFPIGQYAAAGKYSLIVTVTSTLVPHNTNFRLDTAFKVTGPHGIISGYAYTDANGNNIKDAGEAGIAGQYVYLPGFHYATTDSSGYYQFSSLPIGTYAINIYNNPNYLYGGCSTPSYSPASYSVNSNNDSIPNKNFATATITTGMYDLFIHPGWTPANPGFERHYWIFYGNYSPNPAPGCVVTYQYDSTLVFDSCDRVPSTHNLATHTLTWNVGTVSSYWTGGWFDFNLYMKVPVTATTGSILNSSFTISPTADCYPYNNVVVDHSPITSSRDPNEKHANPYSKLIYNKDSTIDYTINFQNTGNASTHFVIVRDSLDLNLDPKTVILTGSSHPVKFNNDGRLLTFTFDPVVLTDSAHDERHSHGSVSFKVKLKPNLPVGTVIKNKANIYFDYNAPVPTNTTVNTIQRLLGILNVDEASKVIVRPNPFTESTTISFSNPNQDKYSLTLHDIEGRIVKTMESSEETFEIQREQLPAGVYIYRLTNLTTKHTMQGKLLAR